MHAMHMQPNTGSAPRTSLPPHPAAGCRPCCIPRHTTSVNLTKCAEMRSDGDITGYWRFGTTKKKQTSSRTSICFVNAGCVLGAHLCVCQTQKPGAARRPDRPGLLLPGGPPGGNPAARPTRQNPDLARQNPDFGPDLRPAFACSETRRNRWLTRDREVLGDVAEQYATVALYWP